MKKLIMASAGFFVLIILTSFLHAPIVIDLQKQFRSKKIDLQNRQLTLINEKGYPGIRMNKDLGEGLAWLKGIDFSNGTIEFDVRGENVKGHSFVGLAFHGVNDSTYDAIYMRPFHFEAKDELLRKRQIQYISLPSFTWQVLRAKYPDKFENSIEPSPDPNSWVHLRIVIQNNKVSTYINNNPEPTLVVEKVTDVHHGAVGLYVADTSGGDFANLKITATE